MRKIIFLDSCVVQRKCGAAVTGAAITGGLGLVNSGSNYLTSSSIANRQIAAQQRENQLNRDWQTQQAEVARQFNTSERVASQDFQREMMEFQNQYNSPLNQVRLLQRAGLNPAVAMGSGMTTHSASPATSYVPSSPMPNAVGGLSPVSQQPLDLQVPQLANGVSALLTGMANAKKVGIETDYLESSIPDMLRNIRSDADLKELTEVGLKLDNYLKEHKLPHDLKMAAELASKAAYDAIVSKTTIGKVENETELLKTQQKLNEVLQRYNDAQFRLLGLDIASYWKRLNSSLSLQSAQAESAKASASLSTAQASAQKFVNDMRSHFSAQEYETYVTQLMKDGMLSEADHAEAMRRLRIIENTHGSEFSGKLDDALEWLKGKISIFGK